MPTPDQDTFTEGGPQLPRTGLVTPRPSGRSPTLVRQSLDALEREIRERETELSKLVSILARESFGREAAKRHKAAIAALKQKLKEARVRASKGRRALLEMERGTDGVPTSRLGRIEAELGAIEQAGEGAARARAALDLVAELCADEPARRLNVKSADKLDALAYAEDASPSTMLADLAASAADNFAGPAEPVEADAASDVRVAPQVGKSLEGQRRLSRALGGGRSK